MNRVNLPRYTDGVLDVYDLVSNGEDYEQFTPEFNGESHYFREVSVGDKLKFELSQGDIEVTTKVTIPRSKAITPMHLVKFEGAFHRVYNTYHHENKDGFRETTLTLVRYNENGN